jgi:hypothetical protein
MALISLEALPFLLLHDRSLVKESNKKIFYSKISKGLALLFKSIDFKMLSLKI